VKLFFSRSRVSSIAAGLLGASVWACTVTTASAPYPDVQSFCAAKAKAECQIASLCAIDQNGCQSTRVTACVQDAAQAMGGPGSRKYTADAAGACIDLVTQAYGSGNSKITYAQLVGSGSISDTCARVFAGNVDKNQACQSDYDCAGTRVCAPIAGTTQHVCADPVAKGAGDFCADPGSTCATDTYCAVQDGGAPQCIHSVTAGPCSDTVPCVSADRCVAGLCEPRAGAGQACTANGDCSPDAPFCDTYAGGICTVGLTFATGALDCHGYQAGASDAGSVAVIADASADQVAPADAGTDVADGAAPADASGADASDAAGE
jgi:hypothetical protein